MSDQSLRDALEELAGQYEGDAKVDDGLSYHRVSAQLRRLLAAHPVEPARPLLDREAVQRAVRKVVFNAFGTYGGSAHCIADAVMELARPMPTEAEVVGALHRALRDGNFAEDPADRRLRQARAVLALLNGSDS